MPRVGTLWSKTGDFSAAVDTSYLLNFPGVFEMSLWESEGDATSFYGLNGTYIASDNTDSTSFVFGAGFATLTVASTTNILAGMYCAIDDLSAGTNATGYYEIVSIDSGTTFTVSGTALDGSAGIDTSDTCSFYVGGISSTMDTSGDLQTSLDTVGPVCGATDGNAINNLDILCHASTSVTLTATVLNDVTSGSSNTRVRMIASNSDFLEDGTKITFISDVTLTTVIFAWEPESDYFEIANFIFDGDGNTTVGIGNSADGIINPTVTNCSFVNLTNGINARGTSPWILNGCSFTGLTTGYNAAASVRGFVNAFNCTFDSCTLGLNITAISDIDNCLIVNGTRGMAVSKNVTITISNSTIFGHSSHGIELSETNGDISVYIANSDISENGGFGIKFNASTGDTNFEVLLNNNFFSNTSGITDFGDGSLEAIKSRFSIESDPLYTNDAIITGFTPTSSSPLIDAGVGGTGDTIGAKCATAGGGGVMPLTGLLS